MCLNFFKLIKYHLIGTRIIVKIGRGRLTNLWRQSSLSN